NMQTLNGLAAAQESNLIELELGVVLLLSIAALVAILIRRIRLPYTVALVMVGLVLSFFPNFLGFSASSDLIIAILVPPLLFEATLHIKWASLKEDLFLVLMLAVLGTMVGTLIVGGIIVPVLEIPIAAAIAFGALISATDPVAVIAFFRTLGVSKRLSILVEGESMFNDGVAIVLFNLAIAAAAANGATSSSAGAGLIEGLVEFLRVSFGGIGIGLALGFLVSYVILKNVDDHLIETATTVALAFGSFVVAEELHLSGILAVVAAGLMVGNIGTQNTSPTTKLTLDNFWEFLAFAVNSLVFLLIGLEIQIANLLPNLVPILVAVLAVLLSRAVIIYALTGLHNRFAPPRQQIPQAYRPVMYWGGLRGAISLALALTISSDVFGDVIAAELRVMTFGVVLFTLLVQGTTIQSVIKRLGLAERPEQHVTLQHRQGLVYAKRAGQQELDRLHDEGILFRDIYEAMRQVYDAELDDNKLALRAHLENFPELEQEMYLQAREDVLVAERSAIGDAARRGLISEDVHHQLIREADNRMAALRLLQEHRGTHPPDEKG
ncbi:MAG: Na+/H+ antiporter, partial [Anaerolineales bacterium]|nr:Na+/H+ antiporter [Anaerolineales bacterium]